jgi:glycosyltransferase involved in cell wall biosynthesis
MKRRILFVTACWPHGRWSGTHFRTLQIARALKSVGDVHLCVAENGTPDQAVRQRTEEEFQVESVARLQVAPRMAGSQRLRELVNPRRMSLYGFVVEASSRARLLGLLESFDLIWVHNLYVADIFNQWRWPRSVLDIDDLPSTYAETVWQTEPAMGKRLQAGLRMLMCARREKLLRERFTTLAVCSEADRRRLHRIDSVHVIPNGFERPTADPTPVPASPPRIGFIGQPGYMPNRQGMSWFVQNCWPRIKKAVPGARLRIVGKGSESINEVEGSDVDRLGWIEDPAAEIATWSMMIVPIRTGAGTRVKIAEAFSRKCPVVSTTLGAFGYDVTNGRELCIADSPTDFADACIGLLRDQQGTAAMAERAFSRFLKEWTWDAIAPRVWAAAEDCLRRSET